MAVVVVVAAAGCQEVLEARSLRSSGPVRTVGGAAAVEIWALVPLSLAVMVVPGTAAVAVGSSFFVSVVTKI